MGGASAADNGFPLVQRVANSPIPTGADFGYFGGGLPSNKTTVDRVDYSNDTPTMSPKGPLSAGRYLLSATGNSSHGYWGGGQGPGCMSINDRMDYSNDTAIAAASLIFGGILINDTVNYI